MAQHPRRVIRDAAYAALVAAMNPVPVFKSRLSPVMAKQWFSELPVVSVYTLAESCDRFQESPLTYRRVCELAVELIAEDNGQLDDVLDVLCRQAELALTLDDTLAGTCNQLRMVRTDIALTDVSDRMVGAARLLFTAEYLDALPDADSAEQLPPLERVWIEYSLNNAQPDSRDRAQTHVEDLWP